MSLADYVPPECMHFFENPDFVKALKGFARYLINEDPEFQTDFKCKVNVSLATSELNILPRITTLEATTGLDDYGLDEEHEPTIPEKIALIEKQLTEYEPRPTVSPVETKIPETKTEMRAACVVEELRASPKDFLTANDIMDILREKLPDSCKVEATVKNWRKVKQDVVNMAVSMFSDVKTNKKSVGRREVRLILGN